MAETNNPFAGLSGVKEEKTSVVTEVPVVSTGNPFEGLSGAATPVQQFPIKEEGSLVGETFKNIGRSGLQAIRGILNEYDITPQQRKDLESIGYKAWLEKDYKPTVGKKLVETAIGSDFLKANQDVLQNMNFFEQLAFAAPNVGIAAALSIATRKPQVGAAYMGLQIMGNSIENLTNQGVDLKRATKMGFLNALAQYPLEQLGLSQTTKLWKFKSAIANRIKDIITATTAEGTTEALRVLPERITDILGVNADKRTLEAIWETLSDPQTYKQMGIEGSMGAIFGFVIGTGGAIKNKSLQDAASDILETKDDVNIIRKKIPKQEEVFDAEIVEKEVPSKAEEPWYKGEPEPVGGYAEPSRKKKLPKDRTQKELDEAKQRIQDVIDQDPFIPKKEPKVKYTNFNRTGIILSDGTVVEDKSLGNITGRDKLTEKELLKIKESKEKLEEQYPDGEFGFLNDEGEFLYPDYAIDNLAEQTEEKKRKKLAKQKPETKPQPTKAEKNFNKFIKKLKEDKTKLTDEQVKDIENKQPEIRKAANAKATGTIDANDLVQSANEALVKHLLKGKSIDEWNPGLTMENPIAKELGKGRIPRGDVQTKKITAQDQSLDAITGDVPGFKTDPKTGVVGETKKDFINNEITRLENEAKRLEIKELFIEDKKGGVKKYDRVSKELKERISNSKGPDRAALVQFRKDFDSILNPSEMTKIAKEKYLADKKAEEERTAKLKKEEADKAAKLQKSRGPAGERVVEGEAGGMKKQLVTVGGVTRTEKTPVHDPGMGSKRERIKVREGPTKGGTKTTQYPVFDIDGKESFIDIVESKTPFKNKGSAERGLKSRFKKNPKRYSNARVIEDDGKYWIEVGTPRDALVPVAGGPIDPIYIPPPTYKGTPKDWLDTGERKAKLEKEARKANPTGTRKESNNWIRQRINQILFQTKELSKLEKQKLKLAKPVKPINKDKLPKPTGTPIVETKTSRKKTNFPDVKSEKGVLPVDLPSIRKPVEDYVKYLAQTGMDKISVVAPWKRKDQEQIGRAMSLPNPAA